MTGNEGSRPALTVGAGVIVKGRGVAALAMVETVAKRGEVVVVIPTAGAAVRWSLVWREPPGAFYLRGGGLAGSSRVELTVHPRPVFRCDRCGGIFEMAAPPEASRAKYERDFPAHAALEVETVTCCETCTAEISQWLANNRD